ncbi:MAG: type II toxin-antitoxin system VapC family toxin [bacterium]|nr:type II toxin-antitoxin system VapC family toxin [bacterium]
MTNEKIFIDTNVLIYYFDETSEHQYEAKKILSTLTNQNIKGIINSYIINEFHYKLIREKKTKNLESQMKSLLMISCIEYKDIEFTKSDILEITKISAKHNLKTFDAYHAYYCKKEKIKKIATFDSDFKNIPWLKIYQHPRGVGDI